jgi:hypothetical protein
MVVAGCDTFWGPHLTNLTGSILSVEMETADGNILKTKLIPNGQIALGGPTGGKSQNIKMVRIYDATGRCIKEVITTEYGEEDAITVD